MNLSEYVRYDELGLATLARAGEVSPEVECPVDLERYPVHDMESARTRGPIAAWRAKSDRTGARSGRTHGE